MKLHIASLGALALFGHHSHSMMPAQAELLGIDIPDGIWTSRGYGYTLQVEGGNVALLEETTKSCVPDPFLLDIITKVEVEGEVVRIWAQRYVPYFVFDRSEAFRSGCADGITPFIGDQGYTGNKVELFDILVQTFDEYYSFFDQRKVTNWTEHATAIRSSLNPESTDKELLGAFQKILGPLDDYHVAIKPDGVNPEVLSRPFDDSLPFLGEFEQVVAAYDYKTYKDDQLDILEDIVSRYMEDGLLKQDTELKYGRFKDAKVGYLHLDTFMPKDIEAYVSDLDTALASLGDTNAIVFDVRCNNGGSDIMALLTASRFAPNRTLAFTRTSKVPDGFAEPLGVYFEPAEYLYDDNRKVAIIISGASYSATETFILAMMQLDKVVLVGRNSGGALSEIPKLLPNGWLFQLSDGWWESADGKCFEAVGIPPDVRSDAELWPLSEREEMRDSWLELAFETVKSHDGASSPATDLVLTTSLTLVFASIVFVLSTHLFV